MIGMVQIVHDSVMRKAACQRPGAGDISRQKSSQNFDGFNHGIEELAVVGIAAS
jgi:hypothetical protein